MADGKRRPPALPQPARVGLRTLIALTMLLIASLGAGVAGWAAIKQQASTALDRRLAQAQTMEIAERLPLIDFSGAARTFQARLDHHLAEVQTQTALADAMRPHDPARAGLYDIASQEALLEANALRPFVEYLPNIINPDQTLDERRVGLVVVGALQRRGFQAQWVEQPGPDAAPDQPARPHIAYLEAERLAAYDEQVLGLALVVVGLVVTLVLLTLADLAGHRRVTAIGLYVLAVTGAAAGLVVAIAIDEALAGIVMGIGGAFAALVVVAWLVGWLGARGDGGEPLQTQGIDPGGGFAGGSLQIQETVGRFSRHVVVWIALAALVSAIIGYGYTVAGSRGDDAAHEAYEQQLEVARRSGRASTAVIGTFEAVADLYERRAGCIAAVSRAEQAALQAASAAPSTADIDRKLHCAALAAANATPVLQAAAELDQRFGPDADPRFPARLQQHVTGATPDANPAEALALWDGYAEIEAFWNGKTTSFLACLTIIAIALYVLGQALAMAHLGVSRAMAACGIAMTLGALGWSAYVWSRPMSVAAAPDVAGCPLPAHLSTAEGWTPEARMRAAAHGYAAGALGLGVAETEDEFAAAISAFECAVRFRPSLTLAYQDLASAKALSQSAHKGQNFYSLPTKAKLDEISESAGTVLDIQRKLGLVANAYALNSHAVALWGLGVRDGKLAPITEALGVVEQAIRLTERLESDRIAVSANADKNLYPWLSVLPLLHLNHSLFLIANDRLDEGRAAIGRALNLGADRDWSMVAAMATATSLLDATCEKLHPALRCMVIRSALAAYRKALLDGRWPEAAEPASGRVAGAGLVATPAKVSLVIRMPSFDPAKDKVQMIWSVIDPQWNVADVLNNVMPAVETSEMQLVKDRGVLVQRRIMPAGNYRRCLSPGRYVAQIFVNGALETTAVGDFKGPRMAASRLDRLNLAFCHPSSWTLHLPPPGADWDPTPMASFANGAGQPVAHLFSFMTPRPADSANADDTIAAAVDLALQRLARLHPEAGGEALKARLKPCAEAKPGDIARAVARGASGLVHVALLDVSGLEGAGACDILNTVTMMQ
jgi:hypothetical protein